MLDYLPTILGFCAAGFDSLVVHSAGSKSVATRFYRRFIVEDVADAYDRSDALDRLRSFEGRLGYRGIELCWRSLGFDRSGVENPRYSMAISGIKHPGAETRISVAKRKAPQVCEITPVHIATAEK